MLTRLSPTSKRSSTIILVLVAVAVAGGVATGWKFTLPGSSSDSVVIEDYPVDVRDKRQLVGLSDNVFVGQVIEQTGVAKDDGGSTYTLFSARVEQNIKGELRGIVVVRQPGGYDEDYAAMQVVNGDSLLQPGGTYLLTTTANPDKTVYTMFAGFGWASLDGPGDPASVIAEYEAAFKNQIVDPRYSD